jgi:hypothetical protein
MPLRNKRGFHRARDIDRSRSIGKRVIALAQALVSRKKRN